MIINKIEKFIFIHIPKTAGFSLQHAIKGVHVAPRHEYVDNIVHEGFFTFAFVRNPWDRLISIHTFGVAGGWIKQKVFKTWLMNEEWWEAEETRFNQHETRRPYQKRPMCDWLTNKNKEIVVDFVGKFENLHQDIDILRNKYGIKIDKVPHLNSSNHLHYHDIYDEDMRGFVERYHKIDINTFNYKF